MSFRSRDLDHLRPGARFVAGRETSLYLDTSRPIPWAEAEAVTVAARGPAGLALESGGVPLGTYGIAHDTLVTTAPGQRPLQAVWTEPLPNAPDAAAAAYGVALACAGDRALLLHVTAVAGGVATADLVLPADLADSPDGTFGDDDPWKTTVVGSAAFWDPPLRLDLAGAVPGRVSVFGGARPAAPTRLAVDDVVPGDLLVTAGFGARWEDGAAILVPHAPVRLARLDRAGVGAFMPRPDPEAPGRFPGATPYAVLDASDLAYEYTRPNERLCLWSEDVDGRRRVAGIAATGAAFHNVDEVDLYLEGEELHPGLWVFENARWQVWTDHEGGHESELDGSWRPAVPEDLARFGLAPEEARTEIAHRLEAGEPRPSIAELMELAAGPDPRATAPTP